MAASKPVTQVPAVPPKITLRVSLRAEFTSTTNSRYWHGSDGDYHKFWDGRAVGNAKVAMLQVPPAPATPPATANPSPAATPPPAPGSPVALNPPVEAVSDARGEASLNIAGLPDGDYVLEITPDSVSADPVGPAIADGLSDPLPARIFRVTQARIKLAGQNLTKAEILPGALTDKTSSTAHAKLGNTILTQWTAAAAPRHLPLDLKPVWAATKLRVLPNNPTLIVVHHTGGQHIGNALNDLLPGNRASAHYVIDHDGWIVKLNRDANNGGHAGPSFWGASGVNGFSIGIEIVNDDDPKTPHAYDEAQYDALLGLVERLIAAYGIAAHAVVGHSDIALTDPVAHLGAKSTDPGTNFEWERLEKKGWSLPAIPSTASGIYGGLFDNDALLTKVEQKNGTKIELRDGDNDASLTYGGRQRKGVVANAAGQLPIAELQADLLHIGYSVKVNGSFDVPTVWAVKMFKEHMFSGTRKAMILKWNRDTVDALVATWIKGVSAAVP